jgi:hypothetical protein
MFNRVGDLNYAAYRNSNYSENQNDREAGLENSFSGGYGAVLSQNLLQSYDKDLLTWLVRMHNALSRKKINLIEISDLIDTLKKLYVTQTDEYLNAILYPEAIKYAKVPSLFPIPTASFQTHFQYSLTTNATGQVAFTWNPWYMQDNGLTTAYSSFFVNNNSTLTGNASNNNFVSTDIGYTQMPTGIYSQYRVVAASCVVTYTGRMDIVSGIICQAVGLNQIANPLPSAAATIDATSQVFGNFNLIDELPFAKQSQAINGTRGIFFPIDNNMLEFAQIPTGAATPTLNNNYKTGFYFAFYGNGLPVASQCLRVDFFIDFEMSVAPSFNNYIPQAYPSQKYTGNHLENISKTLNLNNIITEKDAPQRFQMRDSSSPIAATAGFGDFLRNILGGINQVSGPVLAAMSLIPGIGEIAKGVGVGLQAANAISNALP